VATESDEQAAAEAQHTPSPIRELLALRDFRLYWAAQFLSALIGGIARFGFLWMALEISDRASAPAYLGFAVGMPGLLISLPAGAIADRVDRRRLVVAVSLGGAAFLAATAALIFADLIGLPLAMFMAFGVGSAVSTATPTLQAMVPQLVPPERLMSAVGLQNMGQSGAQFIGAVVGGGSISLMGLGPAFSLWAVIMLLAALLMWFVHLPPYERAQRTEGNVITSVLRDIQGGVSYSFAADPLRSIMTVALFMGTGVAAYAILMPDIGQNELGQDAFRTSILFGILSGGMIASSLYLASRDEVPRQGLLFLITALFFGPGLIVIGLSDSYLITATMMLIWGLSGGVMFTTLRTLLQTHTEDAMMGRVMALFALTFNGLMPVSALYVGLMRSHFGPGDALAIIGPVMFAGTLFIALRSQLRRV
jgi:MFS family permease